MEVSPINVIKRRRTDSDQLLVECFFCKEIVKQSKLRIGSEQGKTRIREAASERRNLGDESYSSLLKEIENFSDEKWKTTFNWHKTCYTDFTSEDKLIRLRGRYRPGKSDNISDACSEQVSAIAPAAASATAMPDSTRLRRSNKSTETNWELCIFCQKEEGKKLRNISTLEMSNNVMSKSQQDDIMRVRVSGVVGDLIAQEGKYHLTCWVQFQRKTQKKTTQSESMPDIYDEKYLNEICDSLIQGLSEGKVYSMNYVWNKYFAACKQNDIEVPRTYITKRSVFNDDVKEKIGSLGKLIRSADRRSVLLYPTSLETYALAEALDDSSNDDADHGQAFFGYETGVSTEMQELVHAALRIRADICNTPAHASGWKNITIQSAMNVIPDSLQLFLSVMFAGEDILEVEEQEERDLKIQKKVISIGQDIVYATSNGSKVTPKHLGLGLTLHQATRSENLVTLFHAAGHTVGIDTIRRVDTSIANDILQHYANNGCVYIPQEIQRYEPGRIILGSFDNIDVLEQTLDGKNTFHCTQIVLWQRGTPVHDNSEKSINRDRTPSREMLKKIQEIDNATFTTTGRPKPVFPVVPVIDNFYQEKNISRRLSRRVDLTWLVSRVYQTDQQHVPHWAGYNEVNCTKHTPLTTAGIIPILQAPADDNDTVTTVLNRLQKITQHLGQKYAVIAADLPLYSRAMEIKWKCPGMYDNVFMLMGGLHIMFNFMKAIGQHMENSGLEDIWIECGILAANSIPAVLEGKAYYRALRAHVLTYEALFRIKWKYFLTWLVSQKVIEDDENIVFLSSSLQKSFRDRNSDTTQNILEMMNALQNNLDELDVAGKLKEFDAQFSSYDPNYEFWNTYMELIETLLDFIRSHRECDFQLHIDAFEEILPWLTVYDHNNYARWGPVYLAQLKTLEKNFPELYEEFNNGNFVVKRTGNNFNEVPIDQATEWVNKICKLSNGVIGITHTDTARDRFCITWGERSRISEETRDMFGIMDDPESITTRKDAQPSRMKRDEDDVRKMVEQFNLFGVFSVCSDVKNAPDFLITLSTKDIASVEIQDHLLTAKERGIKLVKSCVTDRLINQTVPFFSPIKKEKSKTFSTLYKVSVSTEHNNTKVIKTIKTDRKLLQRLLSAQHSGRTVDLQEVLSHELSPIPLSFAKTDGTMNSTTKSNLADILTASLPSITDFPLSSNPTNPTCIIIDGHAYIQSLGKPAGCKTFNDYAERFAKSAFSHIRRGVSRIDIVFDRYLGATSIKNSTRLKRGKKKRPIRKLIKQGDTPLPLSSWEQFISLDDNKADLASFLANYLINTEIITDIGLGGCELVIGGGFESPERAFSSVQGELQHLYSNQEEADTRIILHGLDALQNGMEELFVLCRDTDVLVMLIHFFGNTDKSVVMIGGTSRCRKYYSVTDIAKNLTSDVKENLIGFHSLTGSDTTSSFSGFGKKSCWKIFLQHPHLLHGVGRNGPVEPVEEFVCRLYSSNDPKAGIDRTRYHQFLQGKKELENLPPTKDALQLHLIRCNYQAKIWLAADTPIIDIVSPEATGGWTLKDNALHINWLLKPAVPAAFVGIVSCGCKKKCQSSSCKCRRSVPSQPCISTCGCEASGCLNNEGTDDI